MSKGSEPEMNPNHSNRLGETLNALDDADIRKIIAKKFMDEMSIFLANDGINDVTIDKKDDRVAFVSIWGHGYLVLAKEFKVTVEKKSNTNSKKSSKVTNEVFPIGFVIGEEDGGMDKYWKKILGWKSNYDKDIVDDDFEDDENDFV